METESESGDAKQVTEVAQEETAYSSINEETLILDEFIDRWNEIEPGRLSYETETENIENGVLTGRGSIGLVDSYIFHLNQENNMLKQVSLSLSYPLPEDGGGLGAIPQDIRVLMDVLEPELEQKRKEEMLGTLLNSDVYDVSVRDGKVTYKISNGDDRFWLDVIFIQE